jgi:hypothetical protein
MTPHGEMTRILAEGNFGATPRRVEGTLLDASRAAKRELKFLLVVLHSPGNAASEQFLRETFADRDFSDFVGANLLVWAEADTDLRGSR